jgi:hypothetical protein
METLNLGIDFEYLFELESEELHSKKFMMFW